MAMLNHIRQEAALSLSILSLAAANPEAHTASVPSAHETVPTHIETVDKTIILEHIGDFRSGSGEVSVLKEKGLSVEGTPFTFHGIKKAVQTAEKFTQEQPIFNLNVIAPQGTDHIVLPVSLKENKDKFHGYAIVEDSTTVAQLAHNPQPVLAATDIDLAKHQRTTYIAPALSGAHLPHWDKKIDADDYDLAVETCNNMLAVDLTEKAHAKINRLFNGNVPKTTNLVFMKIGHEAVCNSYALAASAADAELSYAKYQKLAGANTLAREVSLNFNVPYITFNQAQYSQLKRG